MSRRIVFSALVAAALAPSLPGTAQQTVQQLPRSIEPVWPKPKQIVQQMPPASLHASSTGSQPRRPVQIVNQGGSAEGNDGPAFGRRSPGVYVVAPLPMAVVAAPVPPPLPPYAATGVVTVPPPSYVDDSVVVPMYPHVRPDPAWQLCQIDGGTQRRDYYYCGPYSYHPYGADGYRPYVTYAPYRRPTGYGLAPDAPS
jgi:hypothetical protein